MPKFLRALQSAGAAAIAGLALVASLTASTTVHAQSPVVLRAAHDSTTDVPYHLLFVHFAKLVEERTQGKVKIEIFPNAQLGGELELAQGLGLGTIDFSTSSVGNIGPLLPKAALLGVPYLVQNEKHRDLLCANDGEFFKAFSQYVESEKKGIRLLGLVTAGTRNLFNTRRPVATPKDLEGLKIRTMTSDVQVKSWTAFGAVATAMAFAEVYTGMLSGVIDGAEGAPVHYYTMKFNEPAKFFSMTEHMVAMGLFMMSERTTRKLTPEQLDIVLKTAAESAIYERKVDDEVNAKYFERMRKEGVNLVQVDKKQFIDKALPLHDQVAKQLGAEAMLAIVRKEAERAK